MIDIASAERLHLLAEVAAAGSMTAAAERLGYSVSAISQQIRKLEREAGLPLIERHSRGISFTDAGRSVIDHAEAIDGRLKSLQNSLADFAGARKGTITLATFPTAGSSLAPLAISKFRDAHPGVELSVQSARLSTLITLLRTRAIQLSLLWDYKWARLEEPDLDLRFLMDDPADLVVAESHPLAGRTEIDMSRLLDEPWVIRAGTHPNAEVLVHAAGTVGFQPRVAYAANDYQEAQAFVAAGIGIALIPRLALTVLRDDVRAIPLRGDAPSRRIYLARPATVPIGPLEAHMIDAFEEAAEEIVTGRGANSGLTSARSATRAEAAEYPADG